MKLNKLPEAAGRLVKSTVYADSDLVSSIEEDKKKVQFVLVKVKAEVFFCIGPLTESEVGAK